MRRELTVRIAGEAGQGMQTIGLALCRLFKKAGLAVFAIQDSMSRIRGGNNFFQVRVSRDAVAAPRGFSDITVALDEASVALHGGKLASGGLVVCDKDKFKIKAVVYSSVHVPFYEMAQKAGGADLFVNAAAFGALTALVGFDLEACAGVLKDIFVDKGGEVVKKNCDAARAGFDYMKEHHPSDAFFLRPKPAVKTLFVNAHEAIALGALKAGCKFYSAYPMSPSTGIMENMSRFAERYNIVVEQAEDEIAAINMVIGASFAGARSMCATSGGGFALMTEGLSLAGMLETPIVAVDAQRPAPATGFPTRTEQADLDFLIHAGHGEFARVIYAPGSVEEAFYLTQKAFNVAEKYQVPVLIMTDQYLADSYRNIGMPDLEKNKVKRWIISKKDSQKISDYKRYQLTASGISAMAVPSWIPDVIYADSDEHTEEGHITEDAGTRVKMVQKRFLKRMALLSKDVEPPKAGRVKEARTVLVGFGSTLGVLKEACDVLKKEKFGFIHFSQVWPFPARQVSALLKGKRHVYTVENNASGQLARLLRRETGIKVSGSILKYDGRPFDVDYLVARLEKEL
jgi:2-oxoglutarate ferredoxin oxidoreductase subunit alpha